MNKEKIKEEVRDTLEFRSGNINGRLLFYLCAKHFVIHLPEKEKEICYEIVRELSEEIKII